jgi:hypothetical protein
MWCQISTVKHDKKVEKLVMFSRQQHVMLIQRRPHMFGLRDSPPTSHGLTNPRSLFDYYM